MNFVIEALGRFFLSILFLIEGFKKIINYENTIEYMETFYVPGYLIAPAILTEIIFPILLIVGYKTKISALVLASFSIILALIFHNDFSNDMQLIAFLKNFAIAGGFFIIFTYGPGKYSVDNMLKTKKN